MDNIELAIIGGSGLYSMDELTNIEEIRITTPFGGRKPNPTMNERAPAGNLRQHPGPAGNLGNTSSPNERPIRNADIFHH